MYYLSDRTVRLNTLQITKNALRQCLVSWILSAPRSELNCFSIFDIPYAKITELVVNTIWSDAAWLFQLNKISMIRVSDCNSSVNIISA